MPKRMIGYQRLIILLRHADVTIPQLFLMSS
jgi:hypothetical protein